MSNNDDSMMSALGFSGFGSKSGAKKNQPIAKPSIASTMKHLGGVSQGGPGSIGSSASHTATTDSTGTDEKDDKTKRQKTDTGHSTLSSVSLSSGGPAQGLVAYDDSDSDSDFGPAPAPVAAAPVPSAPLSSMPASSNTLSQTVPSNASEESDSDDEYGPQPVSAPSSASAVQPAAAPAVVTAPADDDSADEYSDSDDDAPARPAAPPVPAASAAPDLSAPPLALPLHRGPVSALAAAADAARIYTGGVDGQVLLLEPSSLDARMEPSRAVEPQEGLSIVRIRVCPASGRVLAVPSGHQAHVLDADLYPVATCEKGYPYISDPRHTKGHTARLTDARWHPSAPEFLTASEDGTVRVWTVAGCAKGCAGVIRPRPSVARRLANAAVVSRVRVGESVGVSTVGNAAPVAACCYDRSGGRIAVADRSGTVRVYKHGAGRHTVYRPPDVEWECGEEVTDALFSSANDNQLIIRTQNDTDGSVLIYDSLSGSEVHRIGGLPNAGHGSLALSPCGRWLAVPVGARASGGGERAGRAEEDAEWARAVAEAARGLGGAGDVGSSVKEEDGAVAADAGAVAAVQVKLEEGAEASDSAGAPPAAAAAPAGPRDWSRSAQEHSGPAGGGSGGVVLIECGSWQARARVPLASPAAAAAWSGKAQVCVGAPSGAVLVLGRGTPLDGAASRGAGKLARSARLGVSEVDAENIYCGDEAGRLSVHGRVQKRKRGESTKSGAEAPSGSARGHVNNTSVTHHFMKRILGFDQQGK